MQLRDQGKILLIKNLDPGCRWFYSPYKSIDSMTRVSIISKFTFSPYLNDTSVGLDPATYYESNDHFVCVIFLIF